CKNDYHNTKPQPCLKNPPSGYRWGFFLPMVAFCRAATLRHQKVPKKIFFVTHGILLRYYFLTGLCGNRPLKNRVFFARWCYPIRLLPITFYRYQRCFVLKHKKQTEKSSIIIEKK